MKVSFEDIGQVLATCQAEDGVAVGGVVRMSGNGTVAPCAAGERFCGVALSLAEDGCAAVQVKGFVTVPCADSGVVPGWAALTADGAKGVKTAGAGDKGAELLVVSVENGRAVVCL